MTGEATTTVALRAVDPADVEVFFEHQREPEAVRRANFPARDRAAYFRHWHVRVLGDDSVRCRTVTVDGAVAGNVVAWWENGRRFVGYWLGGAFWGRGVGRRALTAFLAEETRRPLFADTDVGNEASRRLLESCGFVLIDTVRTDEVSYHLLRLDQPAGPDGRAG